MLICLISELGEFLSTVFASQLFATILVLVFGLCVWSVFTLPLDTLSVKVIPYDDTELVALIHVSSNNFGRSVGRAASINSRKIAHTCFLFSAIIHMFMKQLPLHQC